MLMGNGSVKISVDDYVFASINIYTDIIMLFLKIVEFLGDSDRKKKRNKN